MNILFVSLGCDKNLVDTEVSLDCWRLEDTQIGAQRRDRRCHCH